MILDLHIAVKPLSANKMSGRNKSYQTPEYKAYQQEIRDELEGCLLYTSPSPRDRQKSRMPSSA